MLGNYGAALVPKGFYWSWISAAIYRLQNPKLHIHMTFGRENGKLSKQLFLHPPGVWIRIDSDVWEADLQEGKPSFPHSQSKYTIIFIFLWM